MSEQHLVIMAGGIGSRLWPMSSLECPKQFIDVTGSGRTLLQETVERFGSLFDLGRTWVVTSRHYRALVEKQLPGIPSHHIIEEPCQRNTAPCIAYAAWKIQSRHPGATLVVTAADHYVAIETEFREVIVRGLEFVEGSSRVLTLGMTPTRPEVAYGYIESGDPTDNSGFLPVKSFREKPTFDTALQYLALGRYHWNAGLFLMTTDTAMRLIRHYQPVIGAVMDAVQGAFFTPAERAALEREFPRCPKISIDYAVMEPLGGQKVDIEGRETAIYVLPADFGWSDLGTWRSLEEQMLHDEQGNVRTSAGGPDRPIVRFVESRNCMCKTDKVRRVVVAGLERVVVVEHNGTLLVCSKDQLPNIEQLRKAVED